MHVYSARGNIASGYRERIRLTLTVSTLLLQADDTAGLSDFGDPSGNALAARLRSARFAVSVSQFGQAQAMLHLPPEAWHKLHIVRCGIDPAVFPPREEVPINDPPQILSVARLSPDFFR